jgi:3-methyl-2-oxobutanoate hydroxymethyltransferase
MAGLTPGPGPKFLKKYADLRTVLTEAATAYADDVRAGTYPAAEHGYS